MQDGRPPYNAGEIPRFLADVTGSSGHDAAVAASLYARARRYNATESPGVDVRCFYSSGTPTVTGLRWPAGRGSGTGDVSRQPQTDSGDGDGVVPLVSAKACAGVTTRSGAPGVARLRDFPRLQHNALVSDPAAIRAVIELL